MQFNNCLFKCTTIRRRGGTRVAMVTFGTEPRLEFNLGDAKVDTMEKAIEAIDKVKYMGGATASALALKMVREDIVPFARQDSHRAMMFITDGMSNKGGSPKDQAKDLREKDGFEIYAIGKVLILVIIEYLSASKNRSSATMSQYV